MSVIFAFIQDTLDYALTLDFDIATSATASYFLHSFIYYYFEYFFWPLLLLFQYGAILGAYLGAAVALLLDFALFISLILLFRHGLIITGLHLQTQETNLANVIIIEYQKPLD